MIDSLKFDKVLVAQAIQDLHKTTETLRKRTDLQSQVNQIVEHLVSSPLVGQHQSEDITSKKPDQNTTTARQKIKFELHVNVKQNEFEKNLPVVYNSAELQLLYKNRKELFFAKLYQLENQLERKPWKLLLRQKTMFADLQNMLLNQERPARFPKLAFLVIGEGKDTNAYNTIAEKENLISQIVEYLVQTKLFAKVDVYNTYHFSTANLEATETMRAFGRLFSLCIADHVRLHSFHLSRPLLKMICGKTIRYEDLQQVNPSQFQQLETLLLGNQTKVNDVDKYEHIEKVAKQTIVKDVRPLIEAFLFGVFDVIPRQLFECFDENELEILICGSHKVNVALWKSNCLYDNYATRSIKTLIAYEYEVEQVKWFWSIVENDLGSVEQCKLLKRVTGLKHVQDFRLLDPLFTIAKNIKAKEVTTVKEYVAFDTLTC